MKINLFESAPKIEIYNDDSDCIEIKVSHDGKQITKEFLLYRAETITYYKIKKIEIRNIMN